MIYRPSRRELLLYGSALPLARANAQVRVPGPGGAVGAGGGGGGGGGSNTDTVIASVGTIADMTGYGQQRHLIYDGTYWWAFYQKSSTPEALFYARSTNLTTWTEFFAALMSGSSVGTGFGRKLDVAFDPGTATVMISNSINPADQPTYRIGVVSGAIAWDTNRFGPATPLAANGGPQSLAIDSNSKIRWTYLNIGGNSGSAISSSVISNSFADTGGGWSTLTGWTSIVNAWSSIKAIALSGGDVLEIAGDTNRVMARFSSGGTFGGNTTFSSLDPDHWDAVKLSNTDVRLIMAGPNGGTMTAWTCQKFDGSTWSSFTAPSWPSGGLAANSMVSAFTDGTNIWLFVIRGDGNKTVSYSKFNGTSWAAWADITTGSGTGARSYVQAAAHKNGANLAVLWTEANGGNFDIHVGGGSW